MSEAIQQDVSLPAPPARVYAAYMDSAEHAAFTGNGAATIASEAGGTFSAHDGVILGRNVELVPGKRIVQAWRVADWPEGVYSLVRIDLEPAGKGTKLRLHHSAIPEGEREHLESGWYVRYWKPLAEYLTAR